MSSFILGFALSFIITWFICSCYTHNMIALECEKLGGFFVGNKTYKCILIDKKDNSVNGNNP